MIVPPLRRQRFPPPLCPAPAASPVAAPSGDAVYSWQGALHAHLERHKRYPSVAQFRRQQGVPVVRVIMDREGRVLSAQLERTSGHEALDTEALALLTRAQPLPVPPPDVVGNHLELKCQCSSFFDERGAGQGGGDVGQEY